MQTYDIYVSGSLPLLAPRGVGILGDSSAAFGLGFGLAPSRPACALRLSPRGRCVRSPPSPCPKSICPLTGENTQVINEGSGYFA